MRWSSCYHLMFPFGWDFFSASVTNRPKENGILLPIVQCRAVSRGAIKYWCILLLDMEERRIYIRQALPILNRSGPSCPIPCPPSHTSVRSGVIPHRKLNPNPNCTPLTAPSPLAAIRGTPTLTSTLTSECRYIKPRPVVTEGG